MNYADFKAVKAEVDSIIRESWAIYAETGDPRDAEMARVMETKGRELIALASIARNKSKAKFRLSAGARKRKAKKGLIRLNPGASILAQARDLVG